MNGYVAMWCVLETICSDIQLLLPPPPFLHGEITIVGVYIPIPPLELTRSIWSMTSQIAFRSHRPNSTAAYSNVVPTAASNAPTRTRTMPSHQGAWIGRLVDQADLAGIKGSRNWGGGGDIDWVDEREGALGRVDDVGGVLGVLVVDGVEGVDGAEIGETRG